MCTYFICLTGLLLTLVLAEPVSALDIETRGVPGESLCPFIQSAAQETWLEDEARIRIQEAERFSSLAFESLPRQLAEDLAFRGGPAFGSDRQLFESFLANWQFFEDLAPEQRAILQAFLGHCGVAADRLSLAASVFGQLNASQRAVFVGVTHALLQTRLVAAATKEPLGDAFSLLQGLLDIQGENISEPSDHQFQLIVELARDAREKLSRAAHFDKGVNHIFHKGFPLSFRQFRKIGLHGQEAGLHFCLTSDGRFAQVHVDYRFGLLHLTPANSDVRAEGNHQRHADRWPQFSIAIKPLRSRRVVLHKSIGVSPNFLLQD